MSQRHIAGLNCIISGICFGADWLQAVSGRELQSAATWLTRPNLIAWTVAGLVAAGLLAAATTGFVRGRFEGELRDWTVALIFSLLGVRFATHAPRNAVGWLMLAVGVVATANVLIAAWPDVGFLAWIGSWVWLPAYTLIPTLAILFPTGRPPSSAWWLPVVLVGIGTAFMAIGLGVLAWASPTAFWSNAVEGHLEHGWATRLTGLGLALVALSSLSAVVSLMMRWIQQADLRPVLGWAVVCAGLTFVSGALEATVTSSFWSLAALAFPAAAVVAVLRYGLFDIDLIIHRSLLYGLLSVAMLGVYAGAVFAATHVVPQQAQSAAAVVVVLAVLPLRAVLQRRIDRWLYGDRSEPYSVLLDLGRRLEGSLTVDEVLPTLAQHVSKALKTPYVRISVATDSPRGSVEIGRSRGWPSLLFPLTFRGSRIGEIAVEARAPDERYKAREVRLLAALARSAGAAAHVVVLTEDLRLARERLVVAREEERRRLRRDLHDGVGAGLAGTLMQLRTATKRLPDLDRAAPLLHAASQDLVDLTQEVRRVVDDLRPPSLDRGLVEALRQLAVPYSASGLAVSVSVNRQPEPLPAAVEVAAYHIAREALANVARHSGASDCNVAVAMHNEVLRLEIVDNGVGARSVESDRTRIGLGLTSMSERATELGGLLEVVPATPGGLRVLASLPLPGTVALPARASAAAVTLHEECTRG